MQNILIYVIVAAAALYIGRRVYRTLTHKQQAGCEHCSASEVSHKVSSGK